MHDLCVHNTEEFKANFRDKMSLSPFVCICYLLLCKYVDSIYNKLETTSAAIATSTRDVDDDEKLCKGGENPLTIAHD